jgi:DNA-binding CsgD family transcriptional regulator
VRDADQTTARRPRDGSLRSVAGCAESNRGRARQFWRLFDETVVPMVVLDNDRRLLAANRGARLLLRLSVSELLQRRLDDLTTPDKREPLRSLWERRSRDGSASWEDTITLGVPNPVTISYCAIANVLPGQHLMVFMPAAWPEDELGTFEQAQVNLADTSLTPREREVLALIATGADSNEIANTLTIARSTVTTHIEHAYHKLGARNRPHAIALAIQRGLINLPGDSARPRSACP